MQAGKQSGGDKEGGTEGVECYKVDGHIFEVSKRYTLKNSRGHGAFGVVCSAHDTRLDMPIAIKKIDMPFRMVDTSRKLVREIRLLRHFRGHPNIIGLTDLLEPDSAPFDAIYLCTELMDTDLGNLLKSKGDLTMGHFQYFMYQMLCGLHAIHVSNVMHRDLKPANIFVSADCSLKIGDFGLARDQEQDLKSEYVVTRWYRPPELLMNSAQYTQAVDIWSMGCIFAEILSAKHLPLFPGRCYVTQLTLILDVLGNPEPDDYDFQCSDSARKYLGKLKPTPRKNLRDFKVPSGDKYFNPACTDDAFDLVDKMLRFNPAKRPTAEEVLRHEYMGQYQWEGTDGNWPWDASKISFLNQGGEEGKEEKEGGEEEEEEEEDEIEKMKWPWFSGKGFEDYLSNKDPAGVEVPAQELIDRARQLVGFEITRFHPEFARVCTSERLPPEEVRRTLEEVHLSGLGDETSGTGERPPPFDGVKADEAGGEVTTSAPMFTFLDKLREIPKSGPIGGRVLEQFEDAVRFAQGGAAPVEAEILQQVLTSEKGAWDSSACKAAEQVTGEVIKQVLFLLQEKLQESGRSINMPGS